MLDRRKFLLSAATLIGAQVLGGAMSDASAQQLEEVTFLLPAPAAQVAFAPWLLRRRAAITRRKG